MKRRILSLSFLILVCFAITAITACGAVENPEESVAPESDLSSSSHSDYPADEKYNTLIMENRDDLVSYSYYDFDNSGIPLLILKKGSFEANYMYEVYLYSTQYDTVNLLGTIPGSHAALYRKNGSPDLYVFHGSMDSYTLDQISITDNDELETTTIYNGNDISYPESYDLIMMDEYTLD